MYVSIPLIALCLTILSMTAAFGSWVAYRLVRRERAITETVPQLSAAVFGELDRSGRPIHRKGLEGKLEELDRRLRLVENRCEVIHAPALPHQPAFDGSATGPHRVVVIERQAESDSDKPPKSG